MNEPIDLAEDDVRVAILSHTLQTDGILYLFIPKYGLFYEGVHILHARGWADVGKGFVIENYFVADVTLCLRRVDKTSEAWVIAHGFGPVWVFQITASFLTLSVLGWALSFRRFFCLLLVGLRQNDDAVWLLIENILQALLLLLAKLTLQEYGELHASLLENCIVDKYEVDHGSCRNSGSIILWTAEACHVVAHILVTLYGRPVAGDDKEG